MGGGEHNFAHSLYIITDQLIVFLDIKTALKLLSTSSLFAEHRGIAIRNAIISIPAKADLSDVKTRFKNCINSIRYIQLPFELDSGDNSRVGFELVLPIFSQLKTLVAPGLRDLRILKVLDQLTFLDISCISYSFVEPLPLLDISFVARLSNLKSLKMNHLAISSLDPLVDLQHLNFLSFTVPGNTNVSLNLLTLANLLSLTHLSLGGRGLRNALPISHLKNLEALDISDSNISDLGFLNFGDPASVMKLKSLTLSRCPLSNIALISQFKNLQQLDLSETSIDNISGLVSLCSLRKLCLAYTFVANISPLSNMTQLEYIDLSFTYVDDLSSLIHLIGLQTLRLDGSEVDNIDPISTLPRLESLSCNETKLRNVDALKDATRLKMLSLADSNVENISSLCTLENLRELHLAHTRVKDISPLASLKIQVLHLSNTCIKDFSPLKSLSRLTELHISATESCADISALSELQELSVLHLGVHGNCNVSGLKSVMALPKLRFFYLHGSKTYDLDEICEWMLVNNVEFLDWRK